MIILTFRYLTFQLIPVIIFTLVPLVASSFIVPPAYDPSSPSSGLSNDVAVYAEGEKLEILWRALSPAFKTTIALVPDLDSANDSAWVIIAGERANPQNRCFGLY